VRSFRNSRAVTLLRFHARRGWLERLIDFLKMMMVQEGREKKML
jgi:hypothetical protein